jgi:diguanylate cyclase (GGDEF)-like protein/PAS domain S-box-containing protein
MQKPKLPKNESDRLEALNRYHILDTLPEQEYDDLTRLAAEICGTPISLISLVDRDRQWFKSKVGLDVSETPRDISFCGHAVADSAFLNVPDTTQDARFADNPLVAKDPNIRFYAGMPLKTSDNFTLGTLCVIDHQPRHLTEKQIRQLESLSRLAISQFELRRSNATRKAAEDALDEQYKREVLLAEITQRIRQSLNLDAIFQISAQELRQSMNADRIGIFKFDPDSNCSDGEFVSESVIAGFDSVIALKIHDHCFGDQYAAYYKEGRIQVINNINEAGLTDCHQEILQRFQVISNLVVPIIQTEDLWGLLCIHQCSAPRHWQDSEINFARRIASQLEIAIKQVSLFELLEQELLEREKEAEARKILLTELQESESRYRSVITSMSEGIVLQQADGQITACNESAEKILGLSADQMRGLKSVDFERSTIREDGSIFLSEDHPAMVTLRTGQPLTNVIMGICKEDRSTRWISINSQPLCHPDQTFPYAVVASFTDITEQKLAQEMLKMEAELAHVRSLTDGLTQVANRRCFDDRLQTEWQRSVREKQSISLILIDIDYFKLYNDSYGHQAGDACLIQVAQTAASQLKRPADLFARYGGEEFVVILPNTNMEGAITVVEWIQHAIHDLKIPHEASKVSSNVTISLGIASIIPTQEQSPEDLIAIADKNLYQAKQQGRDRFCCYAS